MLIRYGSFQIWIILILLMYEKCYLEISKSSNSEELEQKLI